MSASPAAKAKICWDAAARAADAVVEEALIEAAVWFEAQARRDFSLGDKVRVREDRDLAGFTGVVVAFEDAKDGRGVHVELTGAARGIWRYNPNWIEPIPVEDQMVPMGFEVRG